MAKRKVIDRFNGRYRFLSNFYPCLVMYEGMHFASVENAYQAAKTLDPEKRKRIATQSPPGAKRLGRSVELRPMWEQIKVDVMKQLLVEKFHDDDLAEDLLATGGAMLIEGNSWGDCFWGQVKGEGENWLGRLLMEVREGLRGEEN